MIRLRLPVEYMTESWPLRRVGLYGMFEGDGNYLKGIQHTVSSHPGGTAPPHRWRVN
jgi:hypothetical protein